MERKYNRWVMGAVVGAAAIAATVDHTRHTLPVVQTNDVVVIESNDDESPCSLDASPCSLD